MGKCRDSCRRQLRGSIAPALIYEHGKGVLARLGSQRKDHRVGKVNIELEDVDAISLQLADYLGYLLDRADGVGNGLPKGIGPVDQRSGTVNARPEEAAGGDLIPQLGVLKRMTLICAV
jgi:hypothetical protein